MYFIEFFECVCSADTIEEIVLKMIAGLRQTFRDRADAT